MAGQYFQLPNQQYQDPFVPTNIGLMAHVLDKAQKKQDEGNEALMLLNKPFDSLHQDREKAIAIKQEIDKKINDLGSIDFSSREGKNKLRTLIKDTQDRYNTGDIGAITRSVQAHQEYVKSLDEQLKKGPKEGGIDLDTYKYKLSKSEEDYKGIGEPNNGLYNQFSGSKAAGFSDITEQADKLGKDWKANAVKSGQYKVDPNNPDMFMKKTSSGWEKVSEDEIYNAILPQLMADPNNRAFASQQAEMAEYNAKQRGKEYGQPGAIIDHDQYGNPIQMNPETYSSNKFQDIFHKAADFAAKKYSYKKTEYDEDLHNIPGAEGAADQKRKDKLVTFNEGEAVNLTPADITESKNQLYNLVKAYKKEEQNLLNIETQYGRNSKQYATKKAEMKLMGADITNLKSSTATIDKGMETLGYTKGIDEVYEESVGLTPGKVTGISYETYKKGNPTATKEDFNKYANTPLMSKEQFRKYSTTPGLYEQEYDEWTKDHPGETSTIYNGAVATNIRQGLKQGETAIKKYLEDNKIAYTAEPAHGQPGSTLDNANQLLTKRFQNSLTNYTTVNGMQIEEKFKEKYSDRDPKQDELAITTKSIGGKPVQYLTIKDKDGNKLGVEYIVPKDTESALSTTKTVAESLLNSDNDGDRERGKSMYINAAVLPQIQKANLDSGGIKRIIIDGSSIDARKVEDTQNNITYYELLDPKTSKPVTVNGQPVQAGSEEELAEIIFTNTK